MLGLCLLKHAGNKAFNKLNVQSKDIKFDSCSCPFKFLPVQLKNMMLQSNHLFNNDHSNSSTDILATYTKRGL